jgi:DNA-directed RNA polymerase subunit RPC12/RpoP
MTPAHQSAMARRRRAEAPQDQAMYACDCGFVFEAQVSTSVGCPHCGGTQAW